MTKKVMSKKGKRLCIVLVIVLIVAIVSTLFVFMSNNMKLEKKTEDINKENSELNKLENEDENVEYNDINNQDINEIIETFKPDELGDIPVIMYHAVCENPPSVYQRSIEGFKEDLEYMYSHDYRTLSCNDYVNYNITTEAGKTPIVITFDDGDYRTFALMRDEKENLVPETNCAIDLMEKFYENHKDFGKNAILFINGHNSTFLGKDETITLEERIKWLLDHGYEVSNHTEGHINLKQSSRNEIQKNLANVDKLVKSVDSNAKLEAIAYPFGAMPTKENEDIVLKGTYEGTNYTYKVGFREGPSKVRLSPVIHVDFEPLNAPRLRGNKGEDWDMHYYFKMYEDNPNLRFVSDGDPNRIVVPKAKEDKINKNLEIVSNKEIVTY